MKFELNLNVYENDDTALIRKPFSLNLIKADNLVHLMSQLLIVIVSIQDKLHERAVTELGRVFDDDIPF